MGFRAKEAVLYSRHPCYAATA